MKHTFEKYIQPASGDAVTRRVVIPADILKELKNQRLNDERPYLEQATVHDMAVQLVERGLDLHKARQVEFYQINTRQGNATTVFYFDPQLYAQFEGIKEDIRANVIAKSGAGAVSTLHVIMCLMRAGFESIFPDKSHDLRLEITNAGAEMAVNTDRF